MNPPPLLVLVGPTAVGKTGAAVALCQAFGAEIVNADSVQVYRGLDIGSAKPTLAERAQAPHHLVDVADPDQEMTAAHFAELADQAIAQIRAQGKPVLVAGGTGLYVRALLFGLAPTPAVDPGLRADLARQWQAQGPQALHARLAALDPASAQRLPAGDRQRVLRALEVCLQTGQPYSQHLARHGFSQERHAHRVVGLTRPRPELNQRIEERCRQMWEQGLIEETRALLAAGLSPQAKSLQTLGYRQALAVLEGRQEPQAALAEMIQKTKAYAKRQMTWFRAMQGINWLPAGQGQALAELARSVWREEAVQS